jgi:hypothetical protein
MGVKEGVRGAEDPPRVQTTMDYGWLEGEDQQETRVIQVGGGGAPHDDGNADVFRQRHRHEGDGVDMPA